VSFLAKYQEGGFVDEDIKVHGSADRLCSAAGGERGEGGRGFEFGSSARHRQASVRIFERIALMAAEQRVDYF
jgi:hypothetical protein